VVIPGNDDEGRELQAERSQNEMLEELSLLLNIESPHPEFAPQVG